MSDRLVINGKRKKRGRKTSTNGGSLASKQPRTARRKYKRQRLVFSSDDDDESWTTEINKGKQPRTARRKHKRQRSVYSSHDDDESWTTEINKGNQCRLDASIVREHIAVGNDDEVTWTTDVSSIPAKNQRVLRKAAKCANFSMDNDLPSESPLVVRAKLKQQHTTTPRKQKPRINILSKQQHTAARKQWPQKQINLLDSSDDDGFSTETKEENQLQVVESMPNEHSLETFDDNENSSTTDVSITSDQTNEQNSSESVDRSDAKMDDDLSLEPPFVRTRIQLIIDRLCIENFDRSPYDDQPASKQSNSAFQPTIIKEEDDSATSSDRILDVEEVWHRTNEGQQREMLDEFEESVTIANTFAQPIRKKRTVSCVAEPVYYEIDYIAAGKNKNKRLHYLVKWADYPVAKSTWESSDRINAVEAKLCLRVRKVAISNILGKLHNDQARYAEILHAQENADKPDKRRWRYLERQFEWNKAAAQANLATLYIENWSGVWSNSILAFKYIAQNMFSPKVQAAFDRLEISNENKNSCKKDCECAATKCCTGIGLSFGYKSGCLSHGMRVLKKLPETYLIECGPFCECEPETCQQRVVQNGRTMPLVVFFEGAKGWGVRTIYKIPKRTFVGEYVGEVITPAEAQEEDRMTVYQWQLNVSIPTLDGETLIIDAGKYGNEIRFVNHSCKPNLRAVEVYCSKYGFYNPVIAFFALRDIAAGEELTISYWNTDKTKEPKKKSKKLTCRCGAKECCGWMPVGEAVPDTE